MCTDMRQEKREIIIVPMNKIQTSPGGASRSYLSSFETYIFSVNKTMYSQLDIQRATAGGILHCPHDVPCEG